VKFTPSIGWQPIAALSAILVATVVVYWQALQGPFLLDDYGSIVPLASAQASGLAWDELLRQAPPSIRDRWLSNLSFLLSQAASGNPFPPSPFAFKLGNLIVHIACAVAVFLLGSRLAQRWGANGDRAFWTGALAAGLFALHPLLVSTVLYPVQRMAQLSTLFTLLAVLAYMRWRVRYEQSSSAAHVGGIALTLGLTLLAFLSKENGALVPLLILCIELVAFRWPARATDSRARFDTGFGLICAGPLMLGVVLVFVRWDRFVAGYIQRDFDLGTRLLTQLHVLLDYLGQIFVPRPSSMGLYRDDFPLVSTPEPATVMLGIGFAFALAAALVLRKRLPALSLAVLWFLAAHALESSFVALELVFEHRNYLALPGIAIGLAWGVTALDTGSRARRIFLRALTLGSLALLAGITYQRAADWRDYDRWIEAEARNHPRSLRAGTDLFVHHLARGRPDVAEGVRETLEASLPEQGQPRLLKLGHACPGPIPITLLTAEDLSWLRSARFGKDAFHTYVGLRDLVVRRCEQPDWAAFTAAAAAVATNPHIRRNPRAETAWHRLHASAERNAGNWAGARRAIQRALARDPSDPRDWLMLAEAEARTGNIAGYEHARQELLKVTQGSLGSLAATLREVDALAQRLDAAPAVEP
jgi:tetratricopeptide (TPR) repeat protein